MVAPTVRSALVVVGLLVSACAAEEEPERPFSCETASRCPTVRRDSDDVAACEAELAGPCRSELRAAALCMFDREECTPDGKQDLEKLAADCRSEDAALASCRERVAK